MKSDIIFLDIDQDDKEILKLSVYDSQNNFIESVSQCMKEVREKSYGITWHPVAIKNSNCLIGFAMYGKSKSNDTWLDRFMIDKNFQGKGYGKSVLPLLIKKIKSELNTKTLYLSVNEKNKIAISLYKKIGFEFIDELDGNDPIMKISNI